jgi:hypothetical protein
LTRATDWKCEVVISIATVPNVVDIFHVQILKNITIGGLLLIKLHYHSREINLVFAKLAQIQVN